MTRFGQEVLRDISTFYFRVVALIGQVCKVNPILLGVFGSLIARGEADLPAP